MHFISSHKWLTIIVVLVGLLVVLLLWQVLYIKMHYTASVPAPKIPRAAERFGATGDKLTYVVMGDSTSIGQGTTYDTSIARMSAAKLARNHQVTLTNVGVSGARVADVRAKQLARAAALKPDIVLIAIGANDVTHLTSLSSVRSNITATIAQLQAANPSVRIVLTGSPAMGTVPRFAPPTQWVASWRVRHINAVFAEVAHRTHVILLPLAEKTGPIFRQHPDYFASDNFHPNTAGYAVWQPVIMSGLEQTGL